MYEIYMPLEEYKDEKYLNGYRYYVSNLGNVKNNANEVLKQRKNKDGYMQINLYKDGKYKTHLVHRLVLETFKANPNKKSQVNHINEDKTDNRLNNLEWATPAENNAHGTKIERTSNANKIKVKCIELDKVFDSAQDAALWLNKINGRSSITACCKGRQKSAFGYTWKYVNPKDQITVRTSNANKIKVKCIELDKVFDSAQDAALWLNKINGRSSITACCKGRQKSAFGYTWKYVNPKDQITVTNKSVFNITTNTKYKNAVEASKAYGQVKTDYIYKACRHGNTCGNCQWCFYQEDMENWDPNEFIGIWD